MSTENIREEAEAARAALGKLTTKAKTRRTELNRKRDGLQTERENLVAGARLAFQAIDDEDEHLREEFDQLDGALNPREEEEDDDKQSELQAQFREAARLREENERLEREREEAEREAERLRQEREAAPPTPPPAPEPEERHDDATQVITTVRQYNGVPQTTLGWVLALIGAVVMMVVGLDNRDFVSGLPDIAEAVIQAVFVTALVAAGFGLGGWIGSHFGTHPRRRH